MRLFLAFRAFFLVLFNGKAAQRVAGVLAAAPAAGPAEGPAVKAKAAPPSKPVRSDALTLLATLQREARFVDFVKEPLEAFSDNQIGAVARQIHRDCGQVLGRLFDIQPLLAEPEGSQIHLQRGFDADRYRVTGNVAGEPPFSGRLMHHGWEAQQCQLPAWTGAAAAARVLAPAEVEVK